MGILITMGILIGGMVAYIKTQEAVTIGVTTVHGNEYYSGSNKYFTVIEIEREQGIKYKVGWETDSIGGHDQMNHMNGKSYMVLRTDTLKNAYLSGRANYKIVNEIIDKMIG